MTDNLQHTVDLLARTPAALNALLRGLPSLWIRQSEGEGTWTVFDVIAHLIHAEREDWIPRTRQILESGETKAFPPFNREGNFDGYRQNTLEELLDEFAAARTESIESLRAMQLLPLDLERKGMHPVLGTVKLSELLATWAAHDMTHLHQIARIMAFQYRDEVGPFRKFLGVMHCTGHGDWPGAGNAQAL